MIFYIQFTMFSNRRPKII